METYQDLEGYNIKIPKKLLYIGVDFDGTCVTHAYPLIGEDIGSIPVLLDLIKKGHSIILITMRSGKELDEAVDWFLFNDIPLFGININPIQRSWTSSPKAYCHLYIDDSALGIPLVEQLSIKPYVNWVLVRYLLEKRNIL